MILENLDRQRPAGLILMGGNGTMRAAHRMGLDARAKGIKLPVVGIPATVDNDVGGTDRCTGFASAARFVACSIREVAMDVQSLPLPVTIFETMGRDSGWLAASAVAARRKTNAAPHRVYLPERPFDMERFLEAIRSTVDSEGWALAVVSEGIRDGNGEFVYRTRDEAQQDQSGRMLPGDVAAYLASQVSHRLKLRCRSEKPGLCGRASMAHVSPVDRADAEATGRAAVRSLLGEECSAMIALQPLDETPRDTSPRPSIELIPLEEAIEHGERKVPESWLDRDDEPDDAFVGYLRRLIGPDLPEFPRLES